MAYGTVAELRELLTQVPAGAANDTLLGRMLDRATAIVDRTLGFGFAAYGTAAAKDIRATGGEYLYLPACEAASVTGVSVVYDRGLTGESTLAITGYVADEEARPYRLWRFAGWTSGAWYRVTAKWGYGPAPDDVELVTLEVAVNLWGSRSATQISDVVGVEGGGAVGYNRALTNRQRLILDAVRAQYGEWGAV